MFYPDVFPDTTASFTPERALALELAAVELMVTADRGWFTHHGREGMPAALAHELVFTGALGSEEYPIAAGYFTASADTLWRFVEQRVLGTEPYLHWEWIEPDWEAVRRHLGAAAVTEWRAKVAAAPARWSPPVPLPRPAGVV